MEKITLRTRFVRASLVGLAGFVVAVAITELDRSFRGDWGFVRCAAGGAFLAGLMLARTFGGQGAWGMFCAGLGFGGATVLGAIFAVLLLPFEAWLSQGMGIMGGHVQIGGFLGGAAIGPIYVLSMIAENAGVLMAWAGTLLALQGAAKWLGPEV